MLTGRTYRSTILALLAVVCLTVQAAADPSDDFPFDIFTDGAQIRAWVDIHTLIDESNWANVKDGADLAFELSFVLTTPRKLFGASEASRYDHALRLGYNLVTETWGLSRSTDQFLKPRLFTSQDELLLFLTDSLEFNIADMSSLSSKKEYTLKISVTRLSIAELSGYTEQEADSVETSPLKPLFHAFLDLTQFGRQEFATESRPFRLDELSQ